MKLRYFFLFSLLSLVSFAQKDTKPLIVDSVTHYLNYSNRNYLDIESRFKSAQRAKELSEAYRLDSLGLKSYLSLSTIYFDNVKSTDQKIHYDRKSFLKNAHAALKLATRFNDSIALAQANKDLGYYYFDVLVDSAYYYNNKAEKLYSSLNNNFYTAVVLLDIAMLQRTEEDFAGSEITTITAISLLDELDHQTDSVLRYKSYLYSNLGVVFKELEQYDEAIKYNFKAIELKKRLRGNNEVLIDNQINNLANVYKNTKDYDLAIKYYNEILDKNNIKKERPDFYAMVLDNYANTLFLSKDFSQLPGLFLEALHICDSLGDSYKTIVINQHLAEYYNFKNHKDSAKYYAYKAEKISYPNYTNELLDTYLLLTEIESDSIALKYYDKHVKLSDSLLKKERSTRNKFARIQYETEQIEKENVQIAKERMWLLVVSIVLIIASFLVYVIINQRNKNKELKFIQQQQEANEEIYNLMLSQNESIEEARTLEKKRISQELHDGVLGRLFGARLSLDSLNMGTTPEAIHTRGEYISQLKTIEEDIRKVSHELNTDFVSGAGFVDIISTLVETQTNVYKLKYKLDNDGAINWDNVLNRTKIHIYRIVQETLHNIHKHANATAVKISFKLKKNVICLTINDNGSGFDVNKVKSGIGLKNMNSRIKEINGTLEISSTLNKGTTVKINIPH
ncbi:sensor histidine kinase [Flavobacteriaceae bacterium XHP0103]|uniref:tetratricopeptide repeat-containing sensor histidine kinase n=1 Tax=Marixanthotalea marina TaxID=2844359 RepID=UPI002989D612|nr:sensor histidine kinase [Marixanthotalea marina]MBU3822011.1 sensor histidine kinase [Marixanthotalea marina]